MMLFLVALLIAVFYAFWQIDSDVWMLYYQMFGRDVKSLKGKVIWITGASSGIGAALALCLAKAGCKLVLSARRIDRLNEVKTQCLELNKSLTDYEVFVLPLDLEDIKHHGVFVKQAVSHFGQIDVLVNNAGQFQINEIENCDLQIDRKTFETNVFGTISLTRQVVNHWIANNESGLLAVTSSESGLTASPFYATYSATKHAVQGYFESIRIELHHKGIDTTIVCPGPTQTELFVKSRTGKPGEQLGKSPQVRSMTADRCAELYAIAIANRTAECWIAVQPFLMRIYLNTYFKEPFNHLVKFTITEDFKKRFMRMETY